MNKFYFIFRQWILLFYPFFFFLFDVLGRYHDFSSNLQILISILIFQVLNIHVQLNKNSSLIDNTKCWQRCDATGTLIHCWWECKMVQPLCKTLWQFLIKQNMLSPHNTAIIFLGICLNELTSYVHTKTQIHMFIAALFIIAKVWKQPGCSLVNEWMNKLRYIQTMKYYSAVRRNEL